MNTKKVKLKIKKGDQVIVLTGKDKGKKGSVVKVFPAKMRLLVSGINVCRKSIKPSQHYPEGGIVSVERPIHYSNVGIVDPKSELSSKVGYKTLEDGSKVRYARRSGEIIDNKTV